MSDEKRLPMLNMVERIVYEHMVATGDYYDPNLLFNDNVLAGKVAMSLTNAIRASEINRKLQSNVKWLQAKAGI